MARNYDTSILGEGFELELTPELLAYEMSMDFSDQVLLKCNELGITMSERASALGKSVSNLSEKLNGQNLTLKSMAEIAIALGCDASAPTLIPAEEAISPLVSETILSAEEPTNDIQWTEIESSLQEKPMHSINQEINNISYNVESGLKVA